MKNAKRVALLLGPLILAGAGCADLGQNQRNWLAQGEAAYEAQHYDTANEQLTYFLNDPAAASRPEAARARYVRGMARAKSGQRSTAYADLEQAAAAKADSDIAWRANAVLGVMRFEDGNWTEAARALQAAINGMPAAPPMDAVLFRLGLTRERLGRWNEALAVYQQIRAKFPQGQYADNAARRLQLKADHFAIQCGVFTQEGGAEQMVSNLRGNNLPAYSRAESRNGRSCWVVYVGRYTTYEQAYQALGQTRGYVSDAVLWP